MIVLAGLGFEVAPEEGLSPDERAGLSRLTSSAKPQGPAPAFRLTMADAPSWARVSLASCPDHAPASVAAVGDRLHVMHRRFAAEIDPFAREGRYYRAVPAVAGLETALRVSLQSQLPVSGGVSLHGAGLVVDGAGVVFFGPSGAGKSTLSASSPHPVLSDEMVAVRVAPATLYASGIWGTLGRRPLEPKPVPLMALVQLAQGSRFLMEPLAPLHALRRLIGVTLVPPLPVLWGQALEVLGRLVEEVPTYRMEWSPRQSPWPYIEERLRQA